jgi:hypothetical protein
MVTPQRLAHLLSVPFVAELLAPSYASANRREAAEVYDEVKSGLAAAGLHGSLCDAVWAALKKAHPELDDAALIERLAKALARKGGIKAKEAPHALEERMSALFATIDIHIDRASDAVRAALVTPAGREARDKAVAAAASHLVSLFKL